MSGEELDVTEQQRHIRRLRIAAAALAIVGLLALIATGIAFNQVGVGQFQLSTVTVV